MPLAADDADARATPDADILASRHAESPPLPPMPLSLAVSLFRMPVFATRCRTPLPPQIRRRLSYAAAADRQMVPPYDVFSRLYGLHFRHFAIATPPPPRRQRYAAASDYDAPLLFSPLASASPMSAADERQPSRHASRAAPAARRRQDAA